MNTALWNNANQAIQRFDTTLARIRHKQLLCAQSGDLNRSLLYAQRADRLRSIIHGSMHQTSPNK